MAVADADPAGVVTLTKLSVASRVFIDNSAPKEHHGNPSEGHGDAPGFFPGSWAPKTLGAAKMFASGG